MPRQSRLKSEYSIYHVMQRGNAKMDIFLSDVDKSTYLKILKRVKDKYQFLVYAYCLMDNHIHLIIDDNGNDISQLIKSLHISYVMYFNKKYSRTGHLFQDRFKSQLIDTDSYLLEASKYIHNNPVKAGMVKYAKDYQWSSFNIYSGKEKDSLKLIDKTKILGIISSNPIVSTKQYVEYVNKEEDKEIHMLDIEEDLNKDIAKGSNIYCIEQAKQRIKEIALDNNLDYNDIINNIKIRNKLMKEIRKSSSLTLKEIGQLFGGVSESRVSRIVNR